MIIVPFALINLALTPPDKFTHNGSIYLWQSLNKTMKNQGENKSKINELHDYIHYIANLIGPFYIFCFLLSNTYISDPKREYK